MSFIQNFYTSRDNNTDGNTYVGQEGRLWYNPDTNSIYVNTANVVGGTPVALATGADATFGNVTANIIQINTSANVSSNSIGSIYWNSIDSTININHPNDVTQQVGQEFYVLIENTTGTEIPNGTVVGYTGAMTNGASRMTASPFIANGSTPTLTALGVTTQAIANNTAGFTTMLGLVRDLDTTGATGSETWSQGDILYASPTTAGYFTNVRPTTPNNVVPMAVVLSVDSTAGEIYVRPGYEQQKNYGSFYSNVTQTLNATNTAGNITLNNTVTGQQIDIDETDPSKIIFRQTGFYNIAFSAQVESTNSTTKSMYFWVRKNGTDVPSSTRVVTTTTDNEFQLVSWTTNMSVTTANTYAQFYWATTDTGVDLSAVGSTAFSPSAPSVQIDIVQTAL